MATTLDLPLRRDRTLIYDGVAKRRNPATGNLELWDLSGHTVRLICRNAAGGQMFALVSDTPNADGRIDVAPDQTADRGEYTIRIEKAATGDGSEFPEDEAGYYPFEVWVEEGSGEETTLAFGSFQYAPDLE